MSSPIVALHGFAGHVDSWNAVRAALPGRRVEALRIFGHDETTPATSIVAFEDEVSRLALAVRAIGEPVRLCGYSMGGRLALGILGRAPELVASAILIGAHPGLTSDSDREARAAGDEVWARVITDEGIATFADRWQAQALFATQEHLDGAVLEAQRAIRLRHDPRSLAFAMRSLGLARMPSYWDVLPGLPQPVELVVGALDEKFMAVARRMNGQLARGRVIDVADAGHNVLLERPEVLAQLIASDV